MDVHIKEEPKKTKKVSKKEAIEENKSTKKDEEINKTSKKQDKQK